MPFSIQSEQRIDRYVVFLVDLFIYCKGDPLDIRVFEATNWVFDDDTQQNDDNTILAVIKPGVGVSRQYMHGHSGRDEHKIGIIRRFDFSSKLQRMSVITKNMHTSELKTHIKGSPEKIRQLCAPESIPEDFDQILKKYAEVLAYNS